MQKIKEIARIVKNIRLRPTDFLLASKKKTQEDICFEKLLEGEFSTDLEASIYIFGTDSNHYNYKNLKRRLRYKLVNMLFFLDKTPAKSDYEQAYLYCSKYVLVAKILMGLPAKNAAVDFFHKVVKKAVAYDLTGFIVEASRELRLHYASRVGDEQQFEYYNELLKKYYQIEQAEYLAEEYLMRILLPYVRKKTLDKRVYELGRQYYQDVEPYLERYTSAPYLHYLGKYMLLLAYMSVNDYRAALKICETAVTFFESKSYIHKSPLSLFGHNQLICYILLKKYDEGKKLIEKYTHFMRQGTKGWYVQQELHLLLAFHTKEYQVGEALIYNTLADLNQKKNYILVEQWLIYEAYFHFLVNIQKVAITDTRAKDFKMGKFLNSVPIFSKDKSGLNIAILIIQILFMIYQRDYDKSIDRFEAIQKYCSRYLRQGVNLRSNCFINMLLQIPLANFSLAGTKRRTTRFLETLKATPLQIANQAYEIELIPYEDLWAYVLVHLD